MIGGANGAAEQLGVKRTTLNSKMKKLGIQAAGLHLVPRRYFVSSPLRSAPFENRKIQQICRISVPI